MKMHRIYMSSPDVGALEERYILEALRSGWIAPLGPDVDGFETDMAERIGRKHAVALSSGTAALHLALLARGVGPGDLVLTSTMTFAATANAIVYSGAEPYFIDCLPETGNMDPALLSESLQELEQTGARVAAIMPVDLLGKAVDYRTIQVLAGEAGIPVIADAAESLGASYMGRPTGSWGDDAVFSFNGNKVMTTSGGGMLMTDDEAVASKVRYLATQARQPTLHYEHTEIGFNYRLSNLLAALGRAQLSRLDDMIERRRQIREHYRELFAAVPGVEIFGGANDAEDNCWLTSVVVNESEAGWSAKQLSEALGDVNVETRPLWKPMHLQPVFQQHRRRVNGSSDRLFESGLTLPSGSAMKEQEMSRVVQAIERFLTARMN